MRRLFAIALLVAAGLFAQQFPPSSSGGAPSGAAGGDLSGTYPNPNVAQINGVSLGGLVTGILKNTTSTGIPSIAAGGTDFEFPLTFSGALSRSTNAISCLTATGSQAGCLSSSDWSTFNGKVSTVVHPIGYIFDGGGSALTSGKAYTYFVPFACTITAWNMTVDTGTATVDVWKVASGTAIPTITNTITASALPAIASGTALHSTTLTGWTTSVAANDIIAFNLNAVSSATKVSIVLQCQ